jgi:hypothetical protein
MLATFDQVLDGADGFRDFDLLKTGHTVSFLTGPKDLAACQGLRLTRHHHYFFAPQKIASDLRNSGAQQRVTVDCRHADQLKFGSLCHENEREDIVYVGANICIENDGAHQGNKK